MKLGGGFGREERVVNHVFRGLTCFPGLPSWYVPRKCLLALKVGIIG